MHYVGHSIVDLQSVKHIQTASRQDFDRRVPRGMIVRSYCGDARRIIHRGEATIDHEQAQRIAGWSKDEEPIWRDSTVPQHDTETAAVAEWRHRNESFKVHAAALAEYAAGRRISVDWYDSDVFRHLTPTQGFHCSAALDLAGRALFCA
jgi:hypothetical protein